MANVPKAIQQSFYKRSQTLLFFCNLIIVSLLMLTLRASKDYQY